MALHSFKAKLALDIIKEHFGELVREVASLLVCNDGLALHDIYLYFRSSRMHGQTKLNIQIDATTIRDCLLVLHRQNILHIGIKKHQSIQMYTYT
jgi:hypothetical protein